MSQTGFNASTQSPFFRLRSALLTIVMLFALAACGGGAVSDGSTGSTGGGSSGGNLPAQSLTIEWPANSSSDGVTHYIIVTKLASQTTGIVTLSVSGSTPDLTQVGLGYTYTTTAADLGMTQSGSYEIRVQARNLNGDSELSDPATVIL